MDRQTRIREALAEASTVMITNGETWEQHLAAFLRKWGVQLFTPRRRVIRFVAKVGDEYEIRERIHNSPLL